MTIENCGDELTIDSEPESVLSIGTSAVELLDAAGASDRITARAGEFGNDLPDNLQHAPDDAPIIDPTDPAIETIVGTEADIIVGYGLLNASAEDVAAAGIPTSSSTASAGMAPRWRARPISTRSSPTSNASRASSEQKTPPRNGSARCGRSWRR